MAKLKTNAMRILDAKKIKYVHYEYDPNTTDGLLVAELVHRPREIVFKTLVTEAASKNHYVFVIPVGETLDLKKAAKVVGEKSVSMIKQKELLGLTGYIHGGCSPVGMKKQFRTVFHTTAADKETICVSAGHVGNQVEVPVAALIDIVRGEFADIIV